MTISKIPITIILLLLLSVVVVGGVSVYLHPKPLPNLTRPGAPTPFLPQQANLVLLPLELPIASASGRIQVALTTGASSVNTIQVELSFDPTVLLIEDMYALPTTLIPNAVVLLKDINNQRGRISFALGKDQGSHGESGSGPIAEITYRIISYSKPHTTMRFLPKSLVTTEDSPSSILHQTENVTLTLSSFPRSSSGYPVSLPPNTMTPSPQ